MPMGPKYIVSRKFCGKTRDYQVYLHSIRMYIEIGSNVYEFSKSGEKIFIGQITKRAIVYIFINIMMQAIETLGNVPNSLHLFVDDINRWLDDGEPLKIKITDRIREVDLNYFDTKSKNIIFYGK